MDASLKELAEEHSEICKLFGNASRILILWSLSDRELAVGEIAEEVGTSLENVSQHLSLLKEHGIVTARRDKQTIYYRIADIEWIRECPLLVKAPVHDLAER